jgi:hypothetical protein
VAKKMKRHTSKTSYKKNIIAKNLKKRYLKKHPDSQDFEEKSQIFSKAVHAIFSVYYALEYGHCTTDENQYKICRQFFSDLVVLTREI